MDYNKRVGTLTRHYDKLNGWGDFDIDFGNGRTLGRLEIGREFEALFNGRWEKTRLGWSDERNAYYLDGIGFVHALGMTVRI